MSGDGFDSATLDATLAGSVAGAPRAPVEIGKGTTVGRYVVLERIGSGGMGVVLAAYDPELDRKVALKFLRAAREPRAQARLQHEAQATAKLNHPNVVTVHDVGTIDGRVYVAMEFIAGRTLGKWLTDDTRSWRQILEVMRPAGEGLAAAHDEGLVHRDFKPDNVMVAESGRVIVMDFGLAQPLDPTEPGPQATGRIVGTPRYMAPEQFSGRQPDARTDQYAYCLVLYEALHGHPPFRGDTPAELSLARVEDRLETPPRTMRVPRWVHRVVVRGLAADPAARWPSMRALLAALMRDPTRRRARIALAVGAVTIAGGVWGTMALEERREHEACIGEAGRIAGAWGDEPRDRLRTAILATELPYAAGTVDRLVPRLDAYATEWRDAKERSCLAAARGVVDNEASTRTDLCLDDRHLAFVDLIERLADQPRTAAVQNAVVAVAALRPIEQCFDHDWLARRTSLPREPALRARVADVERMISQAEMHIGLGEMEEASRVIEEAQVQSEGLDWPPLRAKIEYHQASSLAFLGEYESAVTVVRRAEVRAALAGEHDLAIQGALLEMAVLARHLGRPQEALALGEVVGDALDERDAPDDRLQALWLNGRGLAYSGLGDAERAREVYEKALEVRVRALGAQHPEIAQAHNNLGATLSDLGDIEGGIEHLREAEKIRTAALGPDHPHIATTCLNLGGLLFAHGDAEEAERYYRRALDIWSATLAPDHPDLGAAYNGLGQTALAAGDDAAAVDYFRRAAHNVEPRGDIVHPNFARVLLNLCDALTETGEISEALQHCRRGRDILERAFGPDHIEIARALRYLADAQLAAGDTAAARASLTRALSITRTQRGSESNAVRRIEAQLAVLPDDDAASSRPSAANDGTSAPN